MATILTLLMSAGSGAHLWLVSRTLSSYSLNFDVLAPLCCEFPKKNRFLIFDFSRQKSLKGGTSRIARAFALECKPETPGIDA
jgi:hypothetical protein